MQDFLSNLKRETSFIKPGYLSNKLVMRFVSSSRQPFVYSDSVEERYIIEKFSAPETGSFIEFYLQELRHLHVSFNLKVSRLNTSLHIFLDFNEKMKPKSSV